RALVPEYVGLAQADAVRPGRGVGVTDVRAVRTTAVAERPVRLPGKRRPDIEGRDGEDERGARRPAGRNREAVEDGPGIVVPRPFHDRIRAVVALPDRERISSRIERYLGVGGVPAGGREVLWRLPDTAGRRPSGRLHDVIRAVRADPDRECVPGRSERHLGFVGALAGGREVLRRLP